LRGAPKDIGAASPSYLRPATSPFLRGGARLATREVVGRKLQLLFLVACLAGSALTASAGAAGIQDQRVVAPPKRPPQATRSGATGQLIAPPASCPGQDNLEAPADTQEQTMRCMVDFARRQAGLVGLTDAEALDLSAGEKARDIFECDSFSHFACGREFDYWIRESGYMSTGCWHVGENLAWGTGEYGTVRSIFQAWMRSPDHRKNILGEYQELGMNVQVGTLEGQPGTRVWTQHFGTRCGATPPHQP
jgi:uncharacterized protein YkwD